MTGLAALCLAGALGLALLILLAARAMGWRRRRIGMLVRPWLLAILILLTLGLAKESIGGVAAMSSLGWLLAVAWLAVSLVAHLVSRSVRHLNPARKWGARIAHGGVVIAVGGILLSSFLDSTVERLIAPGESIRFNRWTIQLHDVWPAADNGLGGVSAELRASSGDGVVVLEPKQYLLGVLNVWERAQLRDSGGLLTASFGPRDPDGRWPIRLEWTPMLVLIPVGLVIAWLGLMAVMVGPGLLRRRRLRRARLSKAWWA